MTEIPILDGKKATEMTNEELSHALFSMQKKFAEGDRKIIYAINQLKQFAREYRGLIFELDEHDTVVIGDVKKIKIGMRFYKSYDFDIYAITLNENNIMNDVVYFNNRHPSDAIYLIDDLNEHLGYYDEGIRIDFDKIPDSIHSILVGVVIFDADARRQSIGKSTIACGILNDSGELYASYDMNKDMSTSTGVVLGVIERSCKGWVFIALAQGTAKPISEIPRNYDFNEILTKQKE
jgi:tellurium resistance protein TerD